MKKVITLFFALLLFTAYSQNDNLEEQTLTSNKGVIILPVKGEIGLGLGADPFLTYLGNFLSGADKNQLLFNESILNIKYFTSNSKAIRMRIGLNFSNESIKRYVRDDFASIQDPLSLNTTIDNVSLTSHSYFIDVGLEMRKGKNRLQGFYGGGPHFGFGSIKEKYAYGNPRSDINDSPTTFNFYSAGVSNQPNLLEYGRVIEHKNGATWGLGLNSFIGIEYFFLPKTNIGTQVDLNIIYLIQGKEYREVELWESSAIIVETLSPGNRTFNAFTLSTNFNMYLNFHF